MNMLRKVPKKLKKLLYSDVKYFLPEYKIGLNEEVINAVIHVRIDKDKQSNKEKTLKKVVSVLRHYSSNIEYQNNEILCCLTTLFKIDKSDLADFTVQCLKDLSKVKDISVGAHLGKMTPLKHPDGYSIPIFKGSELDLSLVLGDLAEKIKIKTIATYSVIESTKYKDSFVKLDEIKLKDGKTVLIYALK